MKNETVTKTPTTDRIFADAYDQAMPEHGEGWDIFADRIKLAMQDMEDLLRDAADHIETYDDGMAGWIDRASILLDNAKTEASPDEL